MKPVDPEVYRMALDRIDVMKAALRKIAAGDRLAAIIARDALELVSITDAWDNAPLDSKGIPIPPALETKVEQGPQSEAWKCKYCGQLNSAWARQCGRCEDSQADRASKHG